nr:uncharacterized protein LOC109156749 [Ipomoea batatas]
MVAETPLDALPEQDPAESAMQIETENVSSIEGDSATADGTEAVLPQAAEEGAQPKSYLDSVAEATVQNPAAPMAPEGEQVTNPDAQRKLNNPEIVSTGPNKGNINATGSRFAPPEGNDNSESVQGDGTDTVPEMVNSARHTSDQPGTSRQIPGTSTASGRSRRANNESRRAAEEDEHIVNRGEQGGNVVYTTTVLNSERAGENLPGDTGSSQEHHGDPPADFDQEGDVVIEIEGEQEQGPAEGASSPSV